MSDRWKCTALVQRLNNGDSPCGLQTFMDYDRCFMHWKAAENARRDGNRDWIKPPARPKNGDPMTNRRI